MEQNEGRERVLVLQQRRMGSEVKSGTRKRKKRSPGYISSTIARKEGDVRRIRVAVRAPPLYPEKRTRRLSLDISLIPAEVRSGVPGRGRRPIERVPYVSAYTFVGAAYSLSVHLHDVIEYVPIWATRENAAARSWYYFSMMRSRVRACDDYFLRFTRFRTLD